MRCYFESLRPADVSAIHSVPDGIFLVRVDRAQYRWHKRLAMTAGSQPVNSLLIPERIDQS